MKTNDKRQSLTFKEEDHPIPDAAKKPGLNDLLGKNFLTLRGHLPGEKPELVPYNNTIKKLRIGNGDGYPKSHNGDGYPKHHNGDGYPKRYQSGRRNYKNK